jgi:hypothetical protein
VAISALGATNNTETVRSRYKNGGAGATPGTLNVIGQERIATSTAADIFG